MATLSHALQITSPEGLNLLGSHIESTVPPTDPGLDFMSVSVASPQCLQQRPPKKGSQRHQDTLPASCVQSLQAPGHH